MEIAQTCEELLAALQAADVPCAPCLSADELTENDQIKAIGATEIQNHPHLGPVHMPANPVHFMGQRPGPLGPSPLLGEHSEQILSACGYNADELSQMRHNNII